MKIRNIFLLLFVIFSFNSLYSQNTNETPTLSPDTNNSNSFLSIPVEGGGNKGGGTLLEEENKEKERSTNPLEIEIVSPAPAENMKTEESLEEIEASPERSEPVPGAEILIEQEPNEYKNQGPPPNPNNKEKKKKKKPNK